MPEAVADQGRGAAAGLAPKARLGPPVEGVLAVSKERGPTSHDMVAQVRRAVGQRRVGHCGTLDPLASGVLVLCVGRFTRMAEMLSGSDKEYVTLLRLGATSDTYDADGRVEPGATGLLAPPEAAVRETVAAFRGPGMQVPPPYSAVKVGGVPSYRLARRGRQVELEARPICIHRLEVTEYAYPLLRLAVCCTKGTYIRSLAHELGQRLGCGAYVEQLHRTRVGAVTEADTVSVAQLAAAAAQGTAAELMIPLERALPHLPVARLSADQLEAFAAGRPVSLTGPPPAAGPCLVRDPEGRFWGIGAVDPEAGCLRPHRVMAPAEAAAARAG
jgi:tRNA pseudouridine55 synthase